MVYSLKSHLNILTAGISKKTAINLWFDTNINLYLDSCSYLKAVNISCCVPPQNSVCSLYITIRKFISLLKIYGSPETIFYDHGLLRYALSAIWIDFIELPSHPSEVGDIYFLWNDQMKLFKICCNIAEWKPMDIDCIIRIFLMGSFHQA